jgi:hypothetical protein
MKGYIKILSANILAEQQPEDTKKFPYDVVTIDVEIPGKTVVEIAGTNHPACKTIMIRLAPGTATKWVEENFGPIGIDTNKISR